MGQERGEGPASAVGYSLWVWPCVCGRDFCGCVGVYRCVGAGGRWRKCSAGSASNENSGRDLGERKARNCIKSVAIILAQMNAGPLDRLNASHHAPPPFPLQQPNAVFVPESDQIHFRFAWTVLELECFTKKKKSFHYSALN